MAGMIYGGTSGWAYPSWKPGFYPPKWPAKKFLEHYASRLRSVEVNYTFRALPTETQLQGWMAAAPEGFRFSFKAPEMVTHRKRLRDCAEPLQRFVDALAPVREAGQMGCVLFQLPPNFKADVPRLADFLALDAMKSAGRVAFEFRNASWFTDEARFVLREHNAAVCVAESDDLVTPEVHTSRGFCCYRLRMAGGYSEDVVVEHAAKFMALRDAGNDVFVYYKHEDEPTGPLAAERMLQLAAVKG